MSATGASFEALQGALRSLWPARNSSDIGLVTSTDILLLHASSDVAAFTILREHPDRGFSDAYGRFKQMYRANSSDWDARTLSFVVCRSSDDEEDDRFYARLETPSAKNSCDFLFCPYRLVVASACSGPNLPRTCSNQRGYPRPWRETSLSPDVARPRESRSISSAATTRFLRLWHGGRLQA
jgi:hypothetical protein